MSVCDFSSFPNRKYSNRFNVIAFSSNSFSVKTSLPVKNSYSLIFDKYLLIFADNLQINLINLSV